MLTLVAMATNFGTKLAITRPPCKVIASCFHVPPYFRAHAIRWCYLNFSTIVPCCHGNEFCRGYKIFNLYPYLHSQIFRGYPCISISTISCVHVTPKFSQNTAVQERPFFFFSKTHNTDIFLLKLLKK